MFDPIEMNRGCFGCGHVDEIINGEPFTDLDEKTKLCEICYKDFLEAQEDRCPYCNTYCNDCVL